MRGRRKKYTQTHENNLTSRLGRLCRRMQASSREAHWGADWAGKGSHKIPCVGLFSAGPGLVHSPFTSPCTGRERAGGKRPQPIFLPRGPYQQSEPWAPLWGDKDTAGAAVISRSQRFLGRRLGSPPTQLGGSPGSRGEGSEAASALAPMPGTRQRTWRPPLRSRRARCVSHAARQTWRHQRAGRANCSALEQNLTNTHQRAPKQGVRYASQRAWADAVQAPRLSCLHLKIGSWGEGWLFGRVFCSFFCYCFLASS